MSLVPYNIWRVGNFFLSLHRKLVQKGKFAKQTYAVNYSVYQSKDGWVSC